MNQCPYCNFESEDDYCPNDSTRMVLLQPKPKATLKSNFESLFKTFSKHSDVLPVEIAEKFELSKTLVEHKLGYDIWQLEPKVRISVCPDSCSGVVRPPEFLFVTSHFLTYFDLFSHTFFPLRFAA